MEFFLAFFVFIFGTIVGSFLNVIALRKNTGESLIFGSSRCMSCGGELQWRDLVPVLSFIFYRGRCRRCKSKISPQYPLVEFSLGLLYLLLFLRWFSVYSYPSDIVILIWWFALSSLLVLLSVYDIRHHILPDSFSYLFITLSLGWYIFSRGFDVANLALSLIPSLFLFLLWLVSRGRWMGLGDAKLMAGGGGLLAWPGILQALLLSFWTGAVFGLVLILFNPSTKLKSEIPFGPFLALGIIISFFFPEILHPIIGGII